MLYFHFCILNIIYLSLLSLRYFFNFVSLIIMLIIDSKATKFIKASGFRVGLLGADVDEIKKSST